MGVGLLMSDAPKLKRGPLGNIVDEDEISGVHITISGDELTWDTAARQLRTLADLLDAHTLSAEGFNWKYGGDYEMHVHMPDMFSHGDWQDGEGNLIHISDDQVIGVIWAGKDAESETLETPVPAFEWAQKHGALVPAGAGEAQDHEH